MNFGIDIRTITEYKEKEKKNYHCVKIVNFFSVNFPYIKRKFFLKNIFFIKNFNYITYG